MQSKISDKIIYQFPNFKGCIVEGWECTSNLIPHYMMDVITYYAGIKLIYVSDWLNSFIMSLSDTVR